MLELVAGLIKFSCRVIPLDTKMNIAAHKVKWTKSFVYVRFIVPKRSEMCQHALTAADRFRYKSCGFNLTPFLTTVPLFRSC